MAEQGSAVKNEPGAAGDGGQLAEWFACWDTVEALARDANRLYAKCGTSCNADELRQWRERVLVQLKAELATEERLFREISRSADEQLTELPAAALGSAA